MNVEAVRIPISAQSTRDEVIAFLDGLPPESDRDFEKQLTHLISSQGGTLPVLHSVLGDPAISGTVRYGAFFALGTYARRQRDVSELLRLLVTHETLFSGFGTFLHLYSMALRARSGPGDAAAAIDRARDAKSLLPGHSGVLHNFAETVIGALEEGDALADRAGLVEEAEHSLTLALQLEPNYAKFYCTKGRLAALKGRFSEARTLIRRAIDQENSSEIDYWGRVADYQSHLLQVRIREASHKAVHEIDHKVRELRSEFQRVTEDTAKHVAAFNASLKEMQARHLEFLVFFTAILALIISSIQLANRQTMKDVMSTMVMLGGVLVTSFATLGLLIRDSIRRSLLVIGVGVTMCGGAILLWRFA